MIIMLDRTVPVPNGPAAIDYTRIESVDEFRSAAAEADVIWAVDLSQARNQAIVYGEETLRDIMVGNSPRRIRMVAFAIDFRTDQVEHLLAAVSVVKGHAEWNHERITPQSSRLNVAGFATKWGRWGMGSKGSSGRS